MKKLILFLIVIGLFLSSSTTSSARDPKWGGLDPVVVTPDGKSVITGGDNRVLYVVDANTFEVKKRHWFKARIGTMTFNKDNSLLIIEDDDENLHYLKPDTFELVRNVKKVENIVPHKASDTLAGTQGTWSQKEIVLLSMTDASQKGKIVLPKDTKPSCYNFSPDGTKLILLTERVKGDEPKKSYSEIPKDLRGIDRDEFQQKNDGNVSKLYFYEVPSGKELKSFDLWYSSSGGKILVQGEEVTIINYSNDNVKIAADGTAKMFETKNMGYGMAVSPDQKSFILGSLRSGTYVKNNGAVNLEFSLDNLPGWPEYYAGFIILEDGTAYGTTSAYRLIKLDANAQIVKSAPIY
ncbi:hypothetical protein BVX93_01015 [bacterium B13(2017)]|nr:hypothetical protein BVX93_01015 [bacterium B13(2017)]